MPILLWTYDLPMNVKYQGLQVPGSDVVGLQTSGMIENGAPQPPPSSALQVFNVVMPGLVTSPFSHFMYVFYTR